MKTKTNDTYEAFTRTLSTGQSKSDCAKRLYPQHYDDTFGITPKCIKKLKAESGTLDKTPQAALASIMKIPIIISDDISAAVGLYPIAKVRPMT